MVLFAKLFSLRIGRHMPKRERRIGPYTRVHTVDVTGLSCNIKIFCVTDPTATTPLIEGPWLAVGRVKAEAVTTRTGTELILTDTPGSVRVRRTGNATAGPGSYAKSRDVTSGQPIRTHTVQHGRPFQHDGSSSVTITMFVTAGARVLH